MQRGPRGDCVSTVTLLRNILCIGGSILKASYHFFPLWLVGIGKKAASFALSPWNKQSSKQKTASYVESRRINLVSRYLPNILAF